MGGGKRYGREDCDWDIKWNLKKIKTRKAKAMSILYLENESGNIHANDINNNNINNKCFIIVIKIINAWPIAQACY